MSSTNSMEENFNSNIVKLNNLLTFDDFVKVLIEKTKILIPKPKDSAISSVK